MRKEVTIRRERLLKWSTLAEEEQHQNHRHKGQKRQKKEVKSKRLIGGEGECVRR